MTKKQNPVSEMYDNRAGLYDLLIAAVGYDRSIKRVLRAVPLDLPDDARILDLGCGTGLATEVLRERFPNARIIGLDYSKRMLDHYQEKFPDAETVHGDYNDPTTFQSYPQGAPTVFDDSSFDLINSTGSLSEYGKLERALPYFRALLKDGGELVNIGVRDNLLGRFFGKLYGYHPTDLKEMVAASQKSNLCAEEIPVRWYEVPTSIISYAMRARKTRQDKTRE